MKSIEETKNELDIINYGSTPIIRFEKINGYTKPLLSDYEISEIIKDDIKQIKDWFQSKEGLFLGTISSGAHTIDYQEIYKENNTFFTTDKWHREPVAFIYECPGSNLDACFANQNRERDLNVGIPLNDLNQFDKQKVEKLLCDRVWHADGSLENYKHSDFGDGKFSYFDKMKYSEFLLSLIIEFKLANFYTTNFFRYEIFQKNDNSKCEHALNLSDIMMQIDASKFKITNVLATELKVFAPKVIFATSNPYNYLNDYYNKNESSERPIIVKVPHPASRISGATRFLENGINIAEGLFLAGIIGDDEHKNVIEKLIKRYRELYLPNNRLG